MKRIPEPVILLPILPLLILWRRLITRRTYTILLIATPIRSLALHVAYACSETIIIGPGHLRCFLAPITQDSHH